MSWFWRSESLLHAATASGVGVSVLRAPREKDMVSISTARLYFDSCSVPIVLTRIVGAQHSQAM